MPQTRGSNYWCQATGHWRPLHTNCSTLRAAVSCYLHTRRVSFSQGDARNYVPSWWGFVCLIRPALEDKQNNVKYYPLPVVSSDDRNDLICTSLLVLALIFSGGLCSILYFNFSWFLLTFQHLLYTHLILIIECS